MHVYINHAEMQSHKQLKTQCSLWVSSVVKNYKSKKNWAWSLHSTPGMDV